MFLRYDWQWCYGSNVRQCVQFHFFPATLVLRAHSTDSRQGTVVVDRRYDLSHAMNHTRGAGLTGRDGINYVTVWDMINIVEQASATDKASPVDFWTHYSTLKSNYLFAKTNSSV